MRGKTVLMAILEIDATRLHFEVEGVADGDPVLLIAPGGMLSANDFWDRMPWNPRKALASTHRVIGMDQRNAGGSVGPVSAAHGWADYTADQLAVLDHLDIDRCHVVGMCIGGPYIFGLLQAAPERFASAVMLQPVGIDADSRPALREMFDSWAAALAPEHPDMSEADWASFGDNMWNGELVLTATAQQISACTTPMLVLMGDDVYHPQATSRDIVDLAPNATLIEHWKEGDNLVAAGDAIAAFLAANALSG